MFSVKKTHDELQISRRTAHILIAMLSSLPDGLFHRIINGDLELGLELGPGVGGRGPGKRGHKRMYVSDF